MVMGNTNFQTIYPMGGIVNGMVKQATGREPVDNLDMDYVTVAQNTVVGELEFTGDVVQFQTGRSVPIRKLEVSLEPVQSGSGDPSPENVRPITGWNSVNVYKVGKNLFPDAGDIVVTGNRSFSYGRPIIKSGETITVSANMEIAEGFTSCVLFFLRKNNSGIIGKTLTNGENAVTWTAPENVYGFNFYATPSGSTNPGKTTYYNNFQIEIGSTATEYEPYTGETITTEFPTPPGTVYGGTLDVVSGKLTIDRKAVDLGDLTWGKSTRIVNGFVATGDLPDWWYIPDNDNIVIDAIADRYIPGAYARIYASPTNPSNNGKMAFRASASGKGLLIVNYNYSDNWNSFDADAFRTVVAGQKVVLMLQTGEEYQLSPQEVNTLVGDNTIYSDAGTVDVMYWVYKEMF